MTGISELGAVACVMKASHVGTPVLPRIFPVIPLPDVRVVGNDYPSTLTPSSVKTSQGVDMVLYIPIPSPSQDVDLSP